MMLFHILELPLDIEKFEMKEYIFKDLILVLAPKSAYL